MSDRKKIVFLSGSRADFGKLKALIKSVEHAPEFEAYLFVTGMHLIQKYGYTINEIKNYGFRNVFTFMNHTGGESMDLALANTIQGFSNYVKEINPDLIVIHGDRVEALAGAIAGAMQNRLVAHIEGGEVSGTIDELIRHSTTKMSHLHFVANEVSQRRLLQLGESSASIRIIGSPDIDVMLSDDLPSLQEVKARYEIPFQDYGVVIYHPVTTEYNQISDHAKALAKALASSGHNYVVIYPNSDYGCEFIFDAFEPLRTKPNFRFFPSLRFEYFLTLLKEAKFLIGNSSAGIHEAPVFGVPSINIGTRQSNRFSYGSIFNCEADVEKILNLIEDVGVRDRFPSCFSFGDGNSSERFLRALREDALWTTKTQKEFCDL